ncbi:hypothetical protein M2273_002132 [Mucilaginibacter lappiensis]|jgi:hypothetical protein
MKHIQTVCHHLIPVKKHHNEALFSGIFKKVGKYLHEIETKVWINP